jgi:hypothetical protein
VRGRSLLAAVVLPLLIAWAAGFWLVTYGTGVLTEEEWLSAAFDSLARSLVHGEATVDEEAIYWEGIKVDGKLYMYFAPFPALLRIVPGQLYPHLYGRWSRLSCWLAFCLATTAFAVLVLEASAANHTLRPRSRAVIVACSVLAFGLGTVLVYLVSCARIYHEPIIWATAWAAVGLLFIRRCLANTVASVRDLAGLAVASGGALLSRLTFGVPLMVIFAVLAGHTLWQRRAEVMRGAARVRLGLALALLPAVLAVGLTLWYNHARFGSVWETLDYSGFYYDPTEVGGEFNLRRLPSSLLNYFGLTTEYLGSLPPYLRMVSTRYLDDGLFFHWHEETISFSLASGWLVVGGILGTWRILRDRRWRELVAWTALLAQTVLILAYFFVTHRYQAEFMPLFVFSFAVFCARWDFRGRAAALVPRVLVVLALVSVLVSVAATLDWNMRLSGDTPDSYKSRLSQLFGAAPEAPTPPGP